MTERQSVISNPATRRQRNPPKLKVRQAKRKNGVIVERTIRTTTDKAWCGRLAAERGHEKTKACRCRNGKVSLKTKAQMRTKDDVRTTMRDRRIGKCRITQAVKVWHPRMEIITGAWKTNSQWLASTRGAIRHTRQAYGSGVWCEVDAANTRENYSRGHFHDVARDRRNLNRDRKYIRFVRGWVYVLTNTLVRMLREKQIYGGRYKLAAEQAATCSLDCSVVRTRTRRDIGVKFEAFHHIIHIFLSGSKVNPFSCSRVL